MTSSDTSVRVVRDFRVRGSFLRARREHLCISQRELARRCNIEQCTISHVENDMVQPTIKTLGLIAHHLGVPLAQCLQPIYSEETDL